MERIRELARFSVLRAAGYSVLAIALVMAGTLYDPAASLRYGASGLLLLAGAFWLAASWYHHRKRIESTEVWIMLDPAERPPKEIARTLIIAAMRAELLEKALWASVAAMVLLVLSLFLMAL